MGSTAKGYGVSFGVDEKCSKSDRSNGCTFCDYNETIELSTLKGELYGM